MVAIVTSAFGGERPIVQPRLLNESEAQLAQNVRLVSGRIEPLKQGIQHSAISAAVSTIFRYGNTSSPTVNFFSWAEEVHAVRSPIANDQWDRIYWTGQGWTPTSTDNEHYPRYSPTATYAASGTAYRLGIPKPTSISVASGSAVVNATTESRTYVITYTNAASSPTLESLPSREYTLTAADGFPVNFTVLPDNNEGDTRVTHKRIYRKVSGVYRLVTTLALSVTSYKDEATNASLASATQLNTTLANAIARPTTAPVATASGTAVSGSAYERKYLVTFYNGSYTYTQNNGDGGQETITVQIDESIPSNERSIAAIYDGQTVTITGFSVPVGVTLLGGYKIYRKIEGIGQSSFRLLAAVPYTTTQFIDATPHGQEIPETFNSTYYTDTTKKPAQPVATAGSYTNPTVEQRVYCMTFANNSGNESPPSPTSGIVSVTDGQTVNVNVTAVGATGVTLKRLYRKLSTAANTAWRRLGEFPYSQTTFTDTQTNASISSNPSIPTEFGDLLPSPTRVATVSAEIPEKKVPESRTYVYTYVSEYGEEGPPSEASVVIDVDPEQPVTVSNMSGAPSGPYNVTLKRIYRSSTVGNQAQFQLVPVTWAGNSTPSYDVPVAITSVTDSSDQSNLGETLPSETWEPPPAKLFNLRVLANGIAVGFVNDSTRRTVQFSEPFLPHAWPPEYSHVTDDEIVGVGVFRQSVAVLTTAYPYIISGVDPSAMTMTKLELKQGCVSRKSIVETGDGVMYASPDGLFMVGQGGVQNLTASLFSREQWQELNPPSMQCYFHDGRVHIAYKTLALSPGMIILDFSGQGAALTRYTASEIKGGYVDASSDTFYFLSSGYIYRFNQGSDLAYSWRSKLYKVPYPLNFSCGQVLAETYPVTLRVYADGTLRMTKVVSDAKIFTLPSGFRAQDWYYEVSNATTVNGVTTVNAGKVFSVAIAQSHAEIKSV